MSPSEQQIIDLQTKVKILEKHLENVKKQQKFNEKKIVQGKNKELQHSR